MHVSKNFMGMAVVMAVIALVYVVWRSKKQYTASRVGDLPAHVIKEIMLRLPTLVDVDAFCQAEQDSAIVGELCVDNYFWYEFARAQYGLDQNSAYDANYDYHYNLYWYAKNANRADVFRETDQHAGFFFTHVNLENEIDALTAGESVVFEEKIRANLRQMNVGLTFINSLENADEDHARVLLENMLAMGHVNNPNALLYAKYIFTKAPYDLFANVVLLAAVDGDKGPSDMFGYISWLILHHKSIFTSQHAVDRLVYWVLDTVHRSDYDNADGIVDALSPILTNKQFFKFYVESTQLYNQYVLEDIKSAIRYVFTAHPDNAELVYALLQSRLLNLITDETLIDDMHVFNVLLDRYSKVPDLANNQFEQQIFKYLVCKQYDETVHQWLLGIVESPFEDAQLAARARANHEFFKQMTPQAVREMCLPQVGTKRPRSDSDAPVPKRQRV